MLSVREGKKFGGRGRNRTYNLSIKSRMLCQLSYASRGRKGCHAYIGGGSHDKRGGEPHGGHTDVRQLSEYTTAERPFRLKDSFRRRPRS